MLFFTLRPGCTRTAEYITLAANDVGSIAPYYSFKWAKGIVRALNDLRDPDSFEWFRSCVTASPLGEENWAPTTPPPYNTMIWYSAA